MRKIYAGFVFSLLIMATAPVHADGIEPPEYDISGDWAFSFRCAEPCGLPLEGIELRQFGPLVIALTGEEQPIGAGAVLGAQFFAVMAACELAGPEEPCPILQFLGSISTTRTGDVKIAGPGYWRQQDEPRTFFWFTATQPNET
jgi:hypothetical protein